MQEEFIDMHLNLLLEGIEKFNIKLMDYLVWYNPERPHESLNNLAPINFFKILYGVSNVCNGNNLLTKIKNLFKILLKEVRMDSLITLWSIKVKNFLKRERKGAAVLETVLLIIVAVVIIGIILNFFVGKDSTGKSFLGQIFDKIKEFLNLTPTINQ